MSHRPTDAAGPVDLAVIGGGINGTAIACDAAGRGLTVLLCEQDDLGGATSSASSKLIHGGLRYLEHYAFRLVRESLREREVLMAKAPHIIRPLRLVLVHDATLRPVWMIRLGLLLYDHLGRRRTLAASRAIDLGPAPEGAPLAGDRRRGFVYSDGWVDDARLVVLTALGAAQRGAQILTRTECTAAARRGGLWQMRLRDRRTGGVREVAARVLVNAAGPWAGTVGGRIDAPPIRPLRLVKGSHIVVPRLYQGDHAYVLQQPDKRIVFVIPFEDAFSLIGTTELPFAGDPATAVIAAGETGYLCAAVNRYFRRPVTSGEVVWSFAGVRPLWDDDAGDATAVTRDYALEIDAPADAPPLLTVLGGKITTHRVLAESALQRLSPWLPAMGRRWTAAAALPGGDLGAGGMAGLAAALAGRYRWAAPALRARLARLYGSRAFDLLGDAASPGDLGADLGAGLSQRELDFLTRTEWAETAADVVWRRTKLGLRMSAEQRATLAARMAGG
jgi:glycerol-3-phosphate dehydrogenase